MNYFDVAPAYGNAQEQLGNSLLPYRRRIFLACKTGRRDRDGAEEDRGCFPKSWCKPIDTDLEPEFGIAAMKYTLSLGVDTLVPPGNFKSFSFAVEHIDECLASPEPDLELLKRKLETVRGKEFF